MIKIDSIIGIMYASLHTSGTVDNNLGPGRLAGPKALDPIFFADNQPFDCTTFVWKS